MNLNSIRLKQQMLDKIKIITSNAEKNLSVVDYQYNWFDSITENMRITHKNIEDYAYTRIAPFYEILNGDLKKTLMLGDSETDANAAKAAGIPVILLEDG